MMKFAVHCWAAFALTATSSIAVAGNSTADKPARDPDEKVCEKVEVPGSRLATKRVCMTRAQWAERQRLDRQDIDKAQKTGLKSE